jgi:phosphoglycolate phosphatase
MAFAALIDLDGTLVDTIGDIAAAVDLVCERYGLAHVSTDKVRSWIGKGSRQLMVRLLEQAGSDQSPDDALAVFLDGYAKVNGRLATIYPGVLEGLEQLKADGVRIACVTNKHQSVTDALLDQLGLRPYFQAVLGGTSARALKPDPAPLLAACLQLDVSIKAAVMVGDSENDLLAARAAGCTCLLLPYGYSDAAPVQSLGADAIVPSLFAAAQWIAAQRSESSLEPFVTQP